MAKRKPRVLVIDDGLDYARVVEEQLTELELLRPHGSKAPPRLEDGPAALAYLRRNADKVDVALLDLHFDLPEEQLLPLGEGATPRRTRRFQGVAILREIRRRHPELPVVLLTAVEDLSLVDVDGELASQSMTYFLDSDDLDTLRIRVYTALEERAQGRDEGDVLWGADRQMAAVRRRLAVLARGGMPILLEGETGTGKSFLAERVVHRMSAREGPFVTVDLAAVPRDLVPAHLFGALKGSFTGAVADRKGVFELAHRGSLFLDEVQNVPAEVQKQLLVVLQERRVRPLGAAREAEVDVKVVAASNQPLAQAVADGRVRQDLYMRLGPATRVVIPPLRDHADDLPALARALARRAADDADNQRLREEVARAVGLEASAPLAVTLGRGAAHDEGTLLLNVPAPAWKQLRHHPWPGNMRELAMVMHNMVSFTLVAAVDALRSGLSLSSPRLQVDAGLIGELLAGAGSLDDAVGARPGGGDEGEVGVRLRPAETLNKVATDVERQYLRALYQRCQGDFSRMAERLLDDPERARAVRLRFNQVGLKVRELRR